MPRVMLLLTRTLVLCALPVFLAGCPVADQVYVSLADLRLERASLAGVVILAEILVHNDSRLRVVMRGADIEVMLGDRPVECRVLGLEQPLAIPRGGQESFEVELRLPIAQGLASTWNLLRDRRVEVVARGDVDVSVLGFPSEFDFEVHDVIPLPSLR